MDEMKPNKDQESLSRDFAHTLIAFLPSFYEILRKCDLSEREYFALSEVHEFGKDLQQGRAVLHGQFVQRFRSKFGYSHLSGISMLLQKLVESGLLEKGTISAMEKEAAFGKAEARSALLVITARGNRKLEEVESLLGAMLSRATSVHPSAYTLLRTVAAEVRAGISDSRPEQNEMYELGAASSFELSVRQVLALLGYEIQANKTVAGRVMDIVAIRRDPIQNSTVIVEVKDKRNWCDVSDVDQIHSKVLAARFSFPVSFGLLISRSGYTQAALEHASALGIRLMKYDEILNQLVDFSSYLSGLISEFERGSRVYVEPDGHSAADSEIAPLREHVDRWLDTQGAPCLMITGSPGCGKTYFTRQFAYDLAKRYQTDSCDNRAPIRIELRRAPQFASIEQLLLDHFELRLGKSPNPSALLNLIETGRVVLILDGLDELSAQTNSREHCEQVRELIAPRSNNAKILITCRTSYLQESLVLKGIFRHPSAGVIEEGSTVLGRLPIAHAPHVIQLCPFSSDQIRQYIVASGTDHSDEILRRIRETYGLEDLARHPVFLSLIVQCAKSIGDDHVTRGKLYEACVELCLRRDDLRAGMIASWDRRRVFEETAAALEDLQTIRIREEEFKSIMRRTLQPEYVPLLEDGGFDFDMESAAFLTRIEGDYQFVHRSFQEFLLASWIARKIRAAENNAERASHLASIKLTAQVASFLTDLVDRKWLELSISAGTKQEVRQNSRNSDVLLAALSHAAGDAGTTYRD